MVRPRFWDDRPIPELIGLRLAVAVLVAGVVGADAIRDVRSAATRSR
jgi:hypothetical protein